MSLEKSSLHQNYPNYIGFISLLLLLGNAGLQVFSHIGLSAVVKSNLKINVGGRLLVSSFANGEPCSETFPFTWNHTYQYTYSEDLNKCGSKLFFGTEEDFFKCLRDRGVDIADACLECYAIPPRCALDKCGRECISDRDGEDCLLCTRAQCNPQFEECTGVKLVPDEDLPPRPNGTLTFAPSPDPTDFSEDGDDVELFVIYNISFVSSIQDAWRGEAYAIAIVIVIFSGIWPYAKNVIMFCCWFIPMTPERRSSILKNLTRLAKWSLVDVFAIVIILTGVRFNRQVGEGDSIIIIAESRPAIYTFCIAAVWDLVQGEWMRFMHLKLQDSKAKDDLLSEERDGGQRETLNTTNEEGSNSMEYGILKRVSFQKNQTYTCSTFGKIFLVLFMIIQLGLTVVSVISPAIYFEFFGLAKGENSNSEYSPFQIASYLGTSDGLKYIEPVAGTLFLVGMYLLLAIIIPLFQFVAIFLATTIAPATLCCKNQQRFKRFCMSIDIIGGFACQDVFILSFVVVTAEWDKLISSIGELAQEQCNNAGIPDDQVCFAMKSYVGYGLYIMCGAVLMGWILELFFTYSFAQLYHPVEQIGSATKLFGFIVPVFGCGSKVDDTTTSPLPTPSSSDKTSLSFKTP